VGGGPIPGGGAVLTLPVAVWAGADRGNGSAAPRVGAQPRTRGRARAELQLKFVKANCQAIQVAVSYLGCSACG
jgi:hypothetical protein